MKKLILILTLISLVSVLKAQTKTQYHIRVECDKALGDDRYYKIVYTTNNWIGERTIDEIQINEIGYNRYPDDQHTYKEVSTFQIFSTDKNRLIEIAKNFKTYNDVLAYNSRLMIAYNRLKAKFLIEKNKILYPIPKPQSALPVKKQCCKPIQIY